MYQNTEVSETKEFKRPYTLDRETLDGFKSISISVWCYRGNVVNPKWKDVDTGKFWTRLHRLLDILPSGLGR